MTIRPFKITSVEQSKKYIIHDHRGEKILYPIRKLHKQFYKKLLSYPITAFGYELGTYVPDEYKNINPKFDRTDVIKALDFWIEHWVYQNKKDYILEGTVNKDFELTVRELIEFREAVLKMPADTQFVRQKIRTGLDFEREYSLKFLGKDGKEVKHKRNPKEMIEFTENVLQDNSNTSASTVDQFCYVVRKMTYKEYMKQLNNPTISKQNGILSDIIQVQMDLLEERDDGPRFNFGSLFSTRSADASEAFSDLSRTLRQISAGMNMPERPPNAAESSASSTDDDFQIISVPITAQSVTITDDESDSLVFENMHLSSIDGFSFSADLNTSMSMPVVFNGVNGTDITMSLFLTPTQQVRMFDGPLGTVHRIRITPGSQNPVEIDGQNYHVVDINISYNPRNSLSYIFRDLWVESVEATQNTLRVDFASEHRQNISLTLQVDRTMRNEFLSQQGGRSCDLEITGGNSVRINNNGFEVTEPINIMIR